MERTKEMINSMFKTVITVALITSICITGVLSFGVSSVGAKTKKQPKLSAYSVKIVKGSKKTIRIKNGEGKWSIKNKRIVKVQKKTKKYITIKPIKAGHAVIICKSKGEILKCKVRVLNKKSGKTTDHNAGIMIGVNCNSIRNIHKVKR